MMRLQWTHDLDIETLEAKGHWATIEELLEVVTFHLPRYESTVKMCKISPGQANPSDLTFATKFVATYLFIKVKGSRPMTYQYLTVDMISTAKKNGGFIDQKMFKTAGRYGFDSLILTDASTKWLDLFCQAVAKTTVRLCQHSKLDDVMGKLIFDAIGKYIHPTRYRQIVETQSLNELTSEEQKILSEDQKHSSAVAQVHYQKQRSREIAVKDRRKLQGDKGLEVDKEVHTRFCGSSLSAAPSMKNPESKGASPKQDCGPRDPLVIQRSRRRILKFPTEEDDFLKAGIARHGFGKWTAILIDPDFKFQDGRVADFF